MVCGEATTVGMVDFQVSIERTNGMEEESN